MRQEKFKMERPGLLEIGDKVQISEFQSYMNYSYIIEPAVAMSGIYKTSERIHACGHGDVRIPARDVLMKCCKKVGLKVENLEWH